LPAKRWRNECEARVVKTNGVGKLGVSILAASLLGGCFGRKKAAPVAGTSAEPDKILYNRATDDFKHGRYTVGRLNLQTLINTYPDSEYLAKSKLAIGDSYYKEGGMAGLKQSIAEYKDFITFFPFLDESAYAQMQVGMAHFRQMEKPDRDHAEAVEAEAELQTFLEKYPNSPLAPQAQQHLRETQEVLAEGNFRIARFYFIRGANRAAGARLLELTSRYPLYSQADQANLMLAQIYEKTERNDIAGKYYAKIVQEYPLSPLAREAKSKLTKFGAPVPQPDPGAIARMQKEQQEAHNRPGMLRRTMGFVRTAPDVSTAAHTGDPTLTPASETGDETLAIGPGPSLGAGGGGSSSGIGTSATVETVTPGSTAPAAQPAPATSATGASADPSANASVNTDSAGSNTAPAAQDSSAPAPAANKSQESTSKRKKGVRKVIPF
jgi:outer membrane protein assembly factor BamD